jgi:PAS domain S-box-containing protein
MMTGATILYVEDDESSRGVTNEILTRQGFVVLEAVSGNAALRLAESAIPELVILDVNLPDINGYEVCRRLKENPRTQSIPILHVSGVRVTDWDKARGLESGADAYLIKPVEPEELIATVRALLRIGEAEKAHRESEARYEILFEGSSLPTWIFDLETKRCLAANAAAVRHYGYSREEFSSLDAPALCVPEDALAFERYLARIPGSFDHGKWRHKRRDDSVMDVEVVGHELIFNGRRSLLMHARDVTEQNRVVAEREELLRNEQRAREEAQEANRAKDEFLALVTHELRAPLNAMLGWARILQSSHLTEATVLHAAEVIERSARTQSRLIEDLLDTARISTGKLRLDIQSVDLAAVIEDTVDVLLPAAEAKGLDFRVFLDVEKQVISGDPERLQQIVWNLISNAIKFTQNGGRVEVRLDRVDPHLQVSVSDTGKGISSESLPHIFDRFQQVDESGARRRSGLGLGLSLVRDLVELHGGTVRAESKGKDLGSMFSVYLPLRAVASQPADSATDSETGGTAASGELEGVRVLVIDDEADARELVATLLEQLGAKVTAAASAAEAMSVLTSRESRRRPNILISDIGMPDEDGYALIKRVRELPAERGGNIPAIALTAYGRSSDKIRAIGSGFQVHMAKPVEPAELAEVIARLARRTDLVMKAG